MENKADKNKKWAIRFNQDVVLDNLMKSGISVTDSKGNSINITLELDKDNKTIIVNLPKDGYMTGGNYSLKIENNVHCKLNKNLNSNIKVNFNIQDNKDNLQIGI